MGRFDQASSDDTIRRPSVPNKNTPDHPWDWNICLETEQVPISETKLVVALVATLLAAQIVSMAVFTHETYRKQWRMVQTSLPHAHTCPRAMRDARCMTQPRWTAKGLCQFLARPIQTIQLWSWQKQLSCRHRKKSGKHVGSTAVRGIVETWRVSELGSGPFFQV